MTLNSSKENGFPKWALSRPEGKKRELRKEDFKQWDVKCHKISSNKSYHFSYQFFQNCLCVKLTIFTTEIAFCRKRAKLHLNKPQTSELYCSLLLSVCHETKTPQESEENLSSRVDYPCNENIRNAGAGQEIACICRSDFSCTISMPDIHFHFVFLPPEYRSRES